VLADDIVQAPSQDNSTAYRKSMSNDGVLT
jgi:hypothetical protein